MVLFPFVPTFLNSGFGFTQRSQSVGEGYPIPAPTWQAGWEEEEDRGRRWKKVGTYVGGVGWDGEGGQ